MAFVNLNEFSQNLKKIGMPQEVLDSIKGIPVASIRTPSQEYLLADRDELKKRLYFKGLEQQDQYLVSEFKRASTIAGNFPEYNEQVQEVQKESLAIPQINVQADGFKICASNVKSPFPDGLAFYRSESFDDCISKCREIANDILKQCECLEIYSNDGRWLAGYRAGENGITECVLDDKGHFRQTAVLPLDNGLEGFSSRDEVSEQDKNASLDDGFSR